MEDHVRAARTPNSAAQFQATIWLNNYFNNYADHLPNEEKAYVGVYYKLDLYQKYSTEMGEIGIPILKSSLFYNLWRDLFPDALLRRKCNILGKCHLCSRIQSLRDKSRTRVMDEALRQAHLLHRGGLFMIEREEYAKNIDYALKNKDRVMSIVMDGMDQSNCVLPSKGTQDSFTNPLHHKIQGVIIHGMGMKLFSSFDNIVKDTNLAIYAFLCSVEDWAEDHSGKYPEEIFLQVDGGPENISSEFLGMLELLVHKRVARKIMYSRLPTGHTHCDIDGGFGHMKNFFKQHPCETLEDFADGIRACYVKTSLKPKVEFVNVIPDYLSFMRDCVDDISGYAKEERTQHRWLFEAVPLSAEFPFGVKTLHRNYASDIVVEFDECDTSLCNTPVGCHTGLEPRTTFVRWFPSANDNVNMGRGSVEGYYILKNIPRVTTDIMKPAAFDPKAKNSFRDCFAEICRVWLPTSTQYMSWTNWWVHVCPKDGVTAEEYIRNHYYRQPLLHWFETNDVLLLPSWLEGKCQSIAGATEARFVWPEKLSACLNTVSTSWIRQLGPARYIHCVNDALKAKLDIFLNKSSEYYDKLKVLRVEDLKANVKRRVNENGGMLRLEDTKSSLIKVIRDSNISFFKVIHRPLSAEVLHGLNRIFFKQSSIDRNITDIISEFIIDGSRMKISLSTFRQFMNGSELLPESVDYVMALFQSRDDRIAQTHVNVNSNKNYYSVWRRSRFFPSKVFDIIAREFKYKPELNMSSYHRLYFPIFSCTEEATPSWKAVVVEPQLRKMFLVDPHHPDTHPFTENVKVDMESIARQIIRWLEQYGLTGFELSKINGEH